MFGETADERLEALEALRPFALYAEQMKDRWGQLDGCVRYGVKAVGAHQVTYGDFRKAAEVYFRLKRVGP